MATWRNLISYPNTVDFDVASASDRATLDSISELFPSKEDCDRYRAMTDLLAHARENGVITESEHVHLRHIVAPLL